MDLYIGLDLGTTSCKAVLMDQNMIIHANASVPSPMIDGGKVREFDADEFCDIVYRLIRTTVAQYDGPASDIRALCAASASGNTVFLDKNLAPLHNAISWTDRRIEGRSDEYLSGFELNRVYTTTGWPYIEMFPLTHIAWFKKERPHLFAQCAFVCMSTEYLLYKMCGRWGIDPSSATTFYLQDQIRGEYSEEYLSYFGISSHMLPPIMPSKTVLGSLLPDVCARTGLTADTKAVLGSFDHPACARGIGVLSQGELLISCGTSWAGLYVSPYRDAAIDAGMLITPFLPDEDKWACIFAMTQYGEYINKRIGENIDSSDRRFDVFNEAAAAGRQTEAVYCNIVDDGACGKAWANLGKEEIAYSIMHSTSMDVAKRISDMQNRGFEVNRVYMAGGPSSSRLWPQILSDCIGREVYCLQRAFGGAAGAAMMAAIGDGCYEDEYAFVASIKNSYSVYRRKGETEYAPNKAGG